MKSKITDLNNTYEDKVGQLLLQAEQYDDASLNKPPAGGGWSAIQTMHHLILSEELALQYVRKKLGFNPKLQRPGLSAGLRTAALWFYLNLPVKFRAPAAVADDKLPESVSLTETRERWLRIRSEWSNFFHQMDENLARKVVFRHPVVGRLSWSGMLRFFHYHFNRHRRQIYRALEFRANS